MHTNTGKSVKHYTMFVYSLKSRQLSKKNNNNKKKHFNNLKLNNNLLIFRLIKIEI